MADVDGDGQLDIATAQYFGIAQPSFLWLQRVGTPTAGALTSANFVKHVISSEQGTSFQIKPVPNLRGDGVTRWVGTNHLTYPNNAPDGGLFEFSPGADKTQTVAVPDHRRHRSRPDPAPARAHPACSAPATSTVTATSTSRSPATATVACSGSSRPARARSRRTCSRTTTRTRRRCSASASPAARYIADLDGNGTNEMGFSSFDQNTVAIYTRNGGSPVKVTSKLTISGASTVTAGKKTALTLDLTGGAPSTARQAAVTFTPARTGKAVAAGTVTLAAVGSNHYRGAITVTSKESGTYRATYAGRTVTARSVRHRRVGVEVADHRQHDHRVHDGDEEAEEEDQGQEHRHGRARLRSHRQAPDVVVLEERAVVRLEVGAHVPGQQREQGHRDDHGAEGHVVLAPERARDEVRLRRRDGEPHVQAQLTPRSTTEGRSRHRRGRPSR